MKKGLLVLSVAASLLLIGCSEEGSSSNAAEQSSSSSSSVTASAKETIQVTPSGLLADKDGLTLYTFDNDSEAVSNCYDSCAVTWPPYSVDLDLDALPAGLEASMFDVISRNDGTTQVTYNNQPLYYFINDTKAGDINGDNVKDVWHIIEPAMQSVVKESIVISESGLLTNKDGFTLYTFDNDEAGKSNCYDACAVTWPIYDIVLDTTTLPEGLTVADFTTITRDDATTQLAYKDQPLYFFINDTQAGEINGDNVKDVWHIIKPNESVIEKESIAISESGVLTNKDGFTLYTFDNDEAGKSNCYDACAITWPIYDVAIDTSALPEGLEASDFTTITRDDNTTQIAYNDQPLYFFINDTAAGQTNGDNVKDVWHIITPNEVAASASASFTLGNEGFSDYTISTISDEVIAPLSSADPVLNLTVGTRYSVTVTNFNAHPLHLNSEEGVVLLAMDSTVGSFETDSEVNFENDGAGTISFTLTQNLANVLAKYRCQFHSTMTNTIVIN